MKHFHARGASLFLTLLAIKVITVQKPCPNISHIYNKRKQRCCQYAFRRALNTLSKSLCHSTSAFWTMPQILPVDAKGRHDVQSEDREIALQLLHQHLPGCRSLRSGSLRPFECRSSMLQKDRTHTVQPNRALFGNTLRTMFSSWPPPSRLQPRVQKQACWCTKDDNRWWVLLGSVYYHISLRPLGGNLKTYGRSRRTGFERRRQGIEA